MTEAEHKTQRGLHFVLVILLVPWYIVFPRDKTVEEGENSGNAGQNEQVCVESQPGEVEANFDAIVVSDSVKRL